MNVKGKLSYWPFPAVQKMCAKCWVVTTFSRHTVFDVLFYERKDCTLKGDSEATINSLSSEKYPDALKNKFAERSSKYMSFSSKKQPTNNRSERKQFTENASGALQQTIPTQRVQNVLLFSRARQRAHNAQAYRVEYNDLQYKNLLINQENFLLNAFCHQWLMWSCSVGIIRLTRLNVSFSNHIDYCKYCVKSHTYLDIELSDCTQRFLETSKRLLRLTQVYN